MLTSPGRPGPVTRHRGLGAETHAGSTAGQLPAVHPAAGSSRGRRPEAPGPSREGGASGEASGQGSQHSPGLQPSFTDEDGSLQPQGTRRNREGDQEWGGRDQSSISEGKGKGCGNGAETGGKPGPITGKARGQRAIHLPSPTACRMQGRPERGLPGHAGPRTLVIVERKRPV